jgi:hypothetical protein
MYMKKLVVTDYSTGNSYSYGDKSGTWESIVSNGGKINGNSADEPSETQSAPTVTSTASGIPIPWSGTHKETSTWTTPDSWPWVATDSPSASTALPSGWESASRRILPPGSSSISERTPVPFINESVTKIKSSSQSTFQSTSLPWASSLAASSPYGLEASSRNVTRVPSTTSKRTRTRTTTTKTKTTTTKTETKPTKDNELATGPTSTIAPVVNGGISLRTPAMLGNFCALIGGFYIL